MLDDLKLEDELVDDTEGSRNTVVSVPIVRQDLDHGQLSVWGSDETTNPYPLRKLSKSYGPVEDR